MLFTDTKHFRCSDGRQPLILTSKELSSQISGSKSPLGPIGQAADRDALDTLREVTFLCSDRPITLYLNTIRCGPTCVPAPVSLTSSHVSNRLYEVDRLAKEGQHAEAERVLLDLIQNAPNLEVPRTYYTWLLLQTKRFSEALDVVDAGLEIFPASPRLQFYKAVALTLEERLDEAGPYFDRVIDILPEVEGDYRPRAMCGKVALLRRMQRSEESAALRKATCAVYEDAFCCPKDDPKGEGEEKSETALGEGSRSRAAYERRTQS